MGNFQSRTDNIKKHLFESLPGYFHFMDSNKDAQGKGSLQRFFEVFETELAISYGKIKDFIDWSHPSKMSKENLPLLGKHFSSPPTIFGDTILYRRFLSGFKDLMLYKGTQKGLDMLFNLFNCTIELEDVTPPLSFYDTELKHDTGFTHDNSELIFFYVDVKITDPYNYFLGFTNNPVKMGELLNLIYFMVPINVFIYKILLNDEDLGGYLVNEDGLILTTDEDQFLKANV